MSSIPIRNGVLVRLPEYNSWLRSDLYVIGNVFVFIGSEFWENPNKSPSFEVILKGNTLDRDSNGYRMLIVPKENVTILDEEFYGL